MSFIYALCSLTAMSSTLSTVYTCYYQAEKSQPSFWVLVSFSAASVKLLFFVVIYGLVLALDASGVVIKKANLFLIQKALSGDP